MRVGVGMGKEKGMRVGVGVGLKAGKEKEVGKRKEIEKEKEVKVAPGMWWKGVDKQPMGLETRGSRRRVRISCESSMPVRI